jgi:hypothetical protein
VQPEVSEPSKKYYQSKTMRNKRYLGVLSIVMSWPIEELCEQYEFLATKKMKFRGRSSIAADDKVVSTATAKKEWFLKDLSGLPTKKVGWNGPTVYAVKDLDRLALKVHGRDGLAKKKEARKKRLEKKSTKGKTKIGDAAKATGRKKKREDREEEEEKEEEEEVMSRKKRSRKDDNDFVPEKKMDNMLVTSSGRQVSRKERGCFKIMTRQTLIWF